MSFVVEVARSTPSSVDVVGIPVGEQGTVNRALGMSRSVLKGHGFEGNLGQTLVIPGTNGQTLIAVGIGKTAEQNMASLRTAAANLARAAGKRASLSTTLADAESVDAHSAAQAVTEGVMLANYRYSGLKNDKQTPPIQTLTLVVAVKRAAAAAAGATVGAAYAEAASLARDLANTPPAYLTARKLADKAVEIANANGLGVEVFNRDQLIAMGCGGMVGVNAGSVEPPRMVKLTYTPARPTGHLVLVGKGVTYDSGGISLKPSDGMHVVMKMDMSGAAAVLSAMSTLSALGCRAKVTGYLMCTDNMPSGSALKLGDVLTMRNGKTVEIHNTDAEGRLILADGLSLAAELKPDAMIDICTLTGACVAALGERIAGLLGNNQPFIDQVAAASKRVDEATWQLPLAKEYRKALDSHVADMRNIGGPYGGVITSSLFLDEFTNDVPWAHLDIAGPMKVDADEAWLAKGASGYGTRLLIDLALNFVKPKR